MTKKETELINKAMMFCVDKHQGQLYGDNPFFQHPLQVYEIIEKLKPNDVSLQIAALEHDLLEQTQTTEKEILKEFGADVLSLVIEVTKTAYNTFPKLQSQRGILLKYVDRSCNISHIDDWPKDKQQRYLNKSIFWKK